MADRTTGTSTPAAGRVFARPSTSLALRIVILGGGFAGVTAALELARRCTGVLPVHVTLISNQNFFLFTPMLAEAATGAVETRHILYPIRPLCGEWGVEFGEMHGVGPYRCASSCDRIPVTTHLDREAYDMDLGLRGRHAIVTGGSLGIGKAIARELAREGADVAIVARSKDQLEATARELQTETGRRIIPLVADVTNRAQVDAMVEQAAAQLGGLHILVNSGSPPGGSPTAIGPIESLVDEDLLHDFNVKYVGALRCARAAIPHLKKARWGRIINISGTNARNAGNLSGGARNTSLVHLSKTLAVQLGRFGITVNCVHPGITRTERTPRLLAARAKELGVAVDEVEARDFAPDSERGNAICRMVDATEIAYVTAFLASDKAWAISGELVVATGGAGRAVYY